MEMPLLPAASFDIDPTHTPLMVRTRPVNRTFQPLPPGAFESDSRPVLARSVQAGDLIVAAFSEHPTPYRVTRGTSWIRTPYPANPASWDPDCRCEECEDLSRLFGSAPTTERVVLTPNACEGPCDVWEADEPVLIIPAALLLLPLN